MSTEYAKLLRDPRWQKLRLQILERGGWTCQSCGDSSSTLHVHHLLYHYGSKPWEYIPELLLTLCEDCHERETEDGKDAALKFKEAMAHRRLLSEELSLLTTLVLVLPEKLRVPGSNETLNTCEIIRLFSLIADKRVLEKVVGFIYENFAGGAQ
jgi:hypothetical protein